MEFLESHLCWTKNQEQMKASLPQKRIICQSGSETECIDVFCRRHTMTVPLLGKTLSVSDYLPPGLLISEHKSWEHPKCITAF